MDILAMLLYGTLVQVHSPALEPETQFWGCHMDVGEVRDYKQNKDGTFSYEVRHECLNYKIVKKWYPQDRIRKAN